MIPQDYITEWSNKVPWQTNEQVEQDLVICRALIEIFSDDYLSKRLAFRGGTALYKLFILDQSRYSEYIDLVQISAEPFGAVIDKLRDKLSFLGEPIRKQKKSNNTLLFRYESEVPPVQLMKLKVETNCIEHFTVLGYENKDFATESSWFNKSCRLTTYKIEELLGTKLRALYQRTKGRDLYDLYKAIISINDLDDEKVIHCYHQYMSFVVDKLPTQKLFLKNLEEKMEDDNFLGDTKALISPTEYYDPMEAFELVKTKIIEKI